jgi:hypothetical protein
MTVAELIAKLKEMPHDLRVLTPGDDQVDYRGVEGVEIHIMRKRKYSADFERYKERRQAVVMLR